MKAVRFLWAAWCLFVAGAAAQQRDLTSMSLEEFLNIEVTSVSKTRQKLSRSPAAVFVITQDDIRRSGAVTLPEALRLAPGVHVARITGTTWAIGIRGFNNIYSNKLLVMIDGRTIYNALFSGVLWCDDLILLEDIDRIEVIRGPGATMWGANAVTGVINVITKSATVTAGGLAAVSGGNLDPVRARTRYGARFGENSGWRAWGEYSLHGQTELPGTPLSLDRWRSSRAGGRLDWQFRPRDSLLVEGEVQGTSTKVPGLSHEPTAVNGIIVRDAGDTTGFLMGRWTHTTRRGDEATVQAYANEDHIDGGNFIARVRTLDLDFQHAFQLSRRHKLIGGGGIRSNGIRTNGAWDFHFDPADRTYYIANAFLQEEWELRPDQLYITLGGKAERYTLAGVEFQPTARVMWTPTARQGYWVSASRAVRSPAHTDYAVQARIPLDGVLPMPAELNLTGSPQFRPESLIALESGARWQIGSKWAVDIAGFRHWYSELHGYRLELSEIAPAPIAGSGLPVLLIPAITTNGLDGLNQGGEVSAVYDVRPGLQFSGSYSSLFTRTTFRGDLNATNSFVFPSYTPEHEWQLHSSWDFARNWTAEAALYRIGAFPGNALPGYSRLDCRIARSLGEFAEISVSGQNLLRPSQREFVGNILYPSGLVPRNIEMSLRWNF